MGDVSIISIADSDTSACGGALNETFSPPKRRPSMGEKLLPVTPKREANTTMNATFTPEDDRKTAPAKTNNDTFSPVRDADDLVAKCASPLPVVAKSVLSKTPKKKLPEISATEEKAAEEPPVVVVASAIRSKALPDINVVPPTPETRNLRRSMRTPAKAAVETPVATRASTRRSTRAQATPSKPASEKKTTRGRKSKKGAAEEPEPVEQEENKAGEEKSEVPEKTIEEPVKQTEKPDKEEESPVTAPVEEEKVEVPVDSASVAENDQKEEEVKMEPETVAVAESPVKLDTEVAEAPAVEQEPSAKLPETEPSVEVKEEEPSITEEVVQVKEEAPVPEIIEPKREPVLSISDDDEIPAVDTVKEEPVQMAEEQNVEDEEEEVDLLEDEEEPMDDSDEFHAPMLSNDDVLLKSIRKRSLSVTDMNPPLPKRNFRVQFNSPGNMEKTITEIDESLYLNFTKSFASSFSIPAVPAATTDSVVKKPPARRKRSLSNAETPVDKLATLQFLSDKQQKEQPKSSVTSSATKKMPTPSPGKKKMPNFAAIHQNIFQQMESLVDFKERKKERAQFLLTTAPLTPSKSTAIAKPTIAKPVSRGAIGKAKLREIKKPTGNPLKLKNTAIGKKPTVATKMSEKKLAAILQTTDVLADTMTDMEKEDLITDSATEMAIDAKPEEVKENLTTTTAAVPRTASKIKVPTVFSKDAAIKTKPLNVSAGAISLSGLKNRSVAAGKPKDVPVKSATTLGAPQAPAKEADTGKPGNSYKMVKGVRMNRRFELMMMHRNKSDKN